MLPTLVRAEDMSFGDSGACSDPSITSDVFTLPPTNSTGGLCLAFGNHSGGGFSSISLTTTIPDANTDPMLCSGGPFFTTCDFVVDTADDTITVEFFGLDSDHQGIPAVPPNIGNLDLSPDNFTINLNNPICPPTGGECTQTADANGTGDWLTGGEPVVFTGFANGVPEPAAWMLLLGGIGALLARGRIIG